jgi:hypothetical protein
MDFEVEHAAFGLPLFQPKAKLALWNEVNADVFSADATALMSFHQAGGMEKVGEFRGHARRGGGTNEKLHGGGIVAGFLQQFPSGGLREVFTLIFLLVPNQAGGDFDDPALDRDAELLNEHDFVVRSLRQDAHAGVSLGSAYEIPRINAVNSQPFGGKESFWCHPEARNSGIAP